VANRAGAVREVEARGSAREQNQVRRATDHAHGRADHRAVSVANLVLGNLIKIRESAEELEADLERARKSSMLR
jgi:hypothetical protein